MKQCAAVWVILPVVLSAGCGGPTWRDFSPPDKQFHILMYGTPEHLREITRGAVRHTFRCDVESEATYSLQYEDLPVGDVARLAQASAMDAFLTRQAAILEQHTVQGNAVNDQRFVVRGRTVRDLLIAGPAQDFCRVRMLVVSGRFFQLLARGSRARVTSEEANRFFDSFWIG